MNLVNIQKINLSLTLLLISTLLGIAIFNIMSTIFILIIFFEIIKNNDLKYFTQNWFKAIFIFYIIIIISSLLSDYFDNIFFKTLYLFRFLLVAISIQYCLQKFNNTNLFLYTITIMTFFVTFDALIQYFFGTNLFGNNLNYENTSRVRLTGVFGNEEIVGAYLIKFICLGAIGAYFMFKKNITVSMFYIILLGLTILLSQERMAFILYLFFIFLIFSYMLIKKKIKEVIIFCLITLTLISLVFKFDTSLKERYLSIFSSGSGISRSNYSIQSFADVKKSDISIKDSLWGAHFYTAIEIFKNNSIIGSGPRTFRYECGKEKYRDIDIHYIEKRCSTHPHNLYLEILSETGLVGFSYFVFLLILFYLNQYKYFLKTKNYKHFFGLLTIFINLWPIASTGSIYSSFNGLIIWITIGYIFSFSKVSNIRSF